MTKPKPRDRPVSRSKMTFASVTGPKRSNACLSPSSVVPQLRPPTNSFFDIAVLTLSSFSHGAATRLLDSAQITQATVGCSINDACTMNCAGMKQRLVSSAAHAFVFGQGRVIDEEIANARFLSLPRSAAKRGARGTTTRSRASLFYGGADDCFAEASKVAASLATRPRPASECVTKRAAMTRTRPTRRFLARAERPGIGGHCVRIRRHHAAARKPAGIGSMAMLDCGTTRFLVFATSTAHRLWYAAIVVSTVNA